MRKIILHLRAVGKAVIPIVLSRAAAFDTWFISITSYIKFLWEKKIPARILEKPFTGVVNFLHKVSG